VADSADTWQACVNAWYNSRTRNRLPIHKKMMSPSIWKNTNAAEFSNRSHERSILADKVQLIEKLNEADVIGGFNSRYVALLAAIIGKRELPNDICAAAVVSLGKFMSIAPALASQYLLLIQRLANSQQPVAIRCNALGMCQLQAC